MINKIIYLLFLLYLPVLLANSVIHTNLNSASKASISISLVRVQPNNSTIFHCTNCSSSLPIQKKYHLSIESSIANPINLNNTVTITVQGIYQYSIQLLPPSSSSLYSCTVNSSIGTFSQTISCTTRKPLLHFSLFYNVLFYCTNSTLNDTLSTNVNVLIPPTTAVTLSDHDSVLVTCSACPVCPVCPPIVPNDTCTTCSINMSTIQILTNKTAGQRLSIQSEVTAHITHGSYCYIYFINADNSTTQVGTNVYSSPTHWMVTESANPNDLQEIFFTFPFDGNYTLFFCTASEEDQGSIIIYTEGSPMHQRLTFNCTIKPPMNVTASRTIEMTSPFCFCTINGETNCYNSNLCAQANSSCTGMCCAYPPPFSSLLGVCYTNIIVNTTLFNNGAQLYKIHTIESKSVMCANGTVIDVNMLATNGSLMCSSSNTTNCCSNNQNCCAADIGDNIQCFSNGCPDGYSQVSISSCCPNAIVAIVNSGNNYENTTVTIIAPPMTQSYPSISATNTIQLAPNAISSTLSATFALVNIPFSSPLQTCYCLNPLTNQCQLLSGSACDIDFACNSCTPSSTALLIPQSVSIRGSKVVQSFDLSATTPINPNIDTQCNNIFTSSVLIQNSNYIDEIVSIGALDINIAYTCTLINADTGAMIGTFSQTTDGTLPNHFSKCNGTKVLPGTGNYGLQCPLFVGYCYQGCEFTPVYENILFTCCTNVFYPTNGNYPLICAQTYNNSEYIDTYCVTLPDYLNCNSSNCNVNNTRAITTAGVYNLEIESQVNDGDAVVWCGVSIYQQGQSPSNETTVMRYIYPSNGHNYQSIECYNGANAQSYGCSDVEIPANSIGFLQCCSNSQTIKYKLFTNTIVNLVLGTSSPVSLIAEFPC